MGRPGSRHDLSGRAASSGEGEGHSCQLSAGMAPGNCRLMASMQKGDRGHAVVSPCVWAGENSQGFKVHVVVYGDSTFTRV